MAAGLERWEAFTIGELQAITLGFATAGAYHEQPEHPWTDTSWGPLAREASAALATAVAREASCPE